jgi:hypothetical protein
LGEYYLRQRYYDIEAGRFTRRDTYEGRLNEPLSLHKYVYVHNNPVNSTDPTGLYKLEFRYRGFHTDIFITDKNGSRAYWAAAQNQDSGAYVFGAPSNFLSSGDSSSAGFGYLTFNKSDDEHDPTYFEFGTRQALLDSNNLNDEFPVVIEHQIENYLRNLESERVPYNFFKRNSNAAAFQAIENILGYRPRPEAGFLPAWNRDPYTGLTDDGEIALTDRILIGLEVSTSLATLSITSLWAASLYVARFI